MSVADLPERSLGRVRAGDKEGWLALFADDAIVEDPVGPYEWDPEGRGRRGKQEIGAFFDLFSSFQSGFDFEIHDKFACGDEVAVLVSMHISMKDGTRQTTRAINVYKQAPDGRVQSLRSFWNA